MGSWFSSSEPFKVVILGLANAGKTTVVNRIIGDAELNPCPTIGPTFKQYKTQGSTISLWDVGGQDATRKIWGPSVAKCHMLIYIIDLNDVDRIQESFIHLSSLLRRYPKTFSKAPVLIIGNKMDLIPSQETMMFFLRKRNEVANIHWTVNLANSREKNHILYAEISALKGTGVDELKKLIIQELESLYTSYLWQFISDWVY